MPQFVPRENVTFELRNRRPTIILIGVKVIGVAGWTVLNRATMVTLEPPGSPELRLRRLAADGSDLTPDEWDVAIATTGGARVLFPELRVALDAANLDVLPEVTEGLRNLEG